MDFNIKQKGDVLYLHSNDQAIQSALNLKQTHKLELKNLEYLMGCLMFIPKPERILLLGVAGGSLIHFFKHYLPNSHITAVDIDADFIQQMQLQFHLPQADDNLNYVFSDAQSWIQQNQQTYDLIVVDVFNSHQMPEWVMQSQFIQSLKSSLSQSACLALNTLLNSDRDFTQAYSLLRKIFDKRTLCLAAEGYDNTLMYAFNSAPVHNDMAFLLNQAQQSSLLYNIPFHQILSIIFNTNPVDSGYL